MPTSEVRVRALPDGNSFLACSQNCYYCTSEVKRTGTTKFVKFLDWAKKFRVVVGKTVFFNTIKHIRKENKDHFFEELTCFCENETCNKPIVRSNCVKKEFQACDLCGNCGACCSCENCIECNKPFIKGENCNNCKKCNNGCCECVFCGSCDKECGGNSCRDCSYCLECCKCEPEGVQFFNKKITFHDTKRRKINPSGRFVSAEIEVATVTKEWEKGRAVSDCVKHWSGSIVSDGSLPEDGFEINTAPANGDLFVKQINEICEKLKEAECGVTNSCGLHVHVDARDLKYYDIRRLVNYYNKIEPALFAMVPRTRRNNRYCLPCGFNYVDKIYLGKKEKSNLVRKEVIAGVYPHMMAPEYGKVKKKDFDKNNNAKIYKQDKYNSARYNALNVHSWFHRGTVECRLFNGTVNASKIVAWGVLWAMIVDYVVASTDDEINALYLNEPYKNLLKCIKDKKELKEFINERISVHYKENPEQITCMEDVMGPGFKNKIPQY